MMVTIIIISILRLFKFLFVITLQFYCDRCVKIVPAYAHGSKKELRDNCIYAQRMLWKNVDEFSFTQKTQIFAEEMQR